MDTIHTILKDILDIGPACRGEVSEFWVERTGKDGRTRRNGPYHVLQWRSGGKKHSRHVKAEELGKVKEQAARGRTVAAKLAELEEAVWDKVGEGARKKTPPPARPPKGRSGRS